MLQLKIFTLRHPDKTSSCRPFKIIKINIGLEADTPVIFNYVQINKLTIHFE